MNVNSQYKFASISLFVGLCNAIYIITSYSKAHSVIVKPIFGDNLAKFPFFKDKNYYLKVYRSFKYYQTIKFFNFKLNFVLSFVKYHQIRQK